MSTTDRQPNAPPAPSRLYVIIPPAADPGILARALAPALDAAEVAAVLLRLPDADQDGLMAYARPLVSAVQDRGIALLLDGHPELAGRIGADGAHLTGLDSFMAAVDALKPERIAGAGGLRTRHDAMMAAQRGADYVMFGEPDGRRDGQPTGDVRRPPLEAVVERVAWWAELFEPPCVAYAGDLDEVSRLAAAGADFVAIGDSVFSDGAAASSMIDVAAKRLAAAERTAA